MRNNIEIILMLVFVGFLMLFTAKAFIAGVNKHEVGECLRWQEQSRELVGFTMTEWQQKQCQAHNINIAA